MAFCSPAAAQCTTTASAGEADLAVVERPAGRRRPGARGRGARRSRSSGPRRARAARASASLAIVAITVGSMRSITPASSSRRKKSSGDVAAAAERRTPATMPLPHQRVGLHHGAVDHPGITGSHPADRVRVDAVLQQPEARVSRGLAGADDHVAATAPSRGRTRSLTATTRAPSPTSNGGGVVAGMVGARYVASTTRADAGTSYSLPDTVETEPPIADVLAAPEELDAPGHDHPGQRALEVVHDLRRGRPLVQPLLRARRPASGRRRAASTRRRRTRTPGAAGRTGTRRASARPMRGAGRP